MNETYDATSNAAAGNLNSTYNLNTTYEKPKVRPAACEKRFSSHEFMTLFTKKMLTTNFMNLIILAPSSPSRRRRHCPRRSRTSARTTSPRRATNSRPKSWQTPTTTTLATSSPTTTPTTRTIPERRSPLGPTVSDLDLCFPS